MLLRRSDIIEVDLTYFLVLRKFLSGRFLWQENNLLFQKFSRKVSEYSKLQRLHEKFVFGDVAKEGVQQLLSFEYKLFVHITLEHLKRTLTYNSLFGWKSGHEEPHPAFLEALS